MCGHVDGRFKDEGLPKINKTTPGVPAGGAAEGRGWCHSLSGRSLVENMMSDGSQEKRIISRESSHLLLELC